MSSIETYSSVSADGQDRLEYLLNVQVGRQARQNNTGPVCCTCACHPMPCNSRCWCSPEEGAKKQGLPFSSSPSRCCCVAVTWRDTYCTASTCALPRPRRPPFFCSGKMISHRLVVRQKQDRTACRASPGLAVPADNRHRVPPYQPCQLPANRNKS